MECLWPIEGDCFYRGMLAGKVKYIFLMTAIKFVIEKYILPYSNKHLSRIKFNCKLDHLKLFDSIEISLETRIQDFEMGGEFLS